MCVNSQQIQPITKLTLQLGVINSTVYAVAVTSIRGLVRHGEGGGGLDRGVTGLDRRVGLDRPVVGLDRLVGLDREGAVWTGGRSGPGGWWSGPEAVWTRRAQSGPPRPV